MNPRVQSVQAKDDITLELTFTNGEVRLFDVKPFLNKGIFQSLSDPSIFRSAKVTFGSIEWPGKIDLCPDTLYLESIPYPSIP